jgi:hypothetical protein
MTYDLSLGIHLPIKGIHSNQAKIGLDYLQMSNF